MRLVFAGTPETAVPSLAAIADAGHEIMAVLTRPPAPQGRSKQPVPSPVQAWADTRGIEVLTPTSPREPLLAARLAELSPDCCPVVAYGGLLGAELLGIPTHGWVNLHFSLLPRWRGAAPVQRAIMAGDTITGATTFRIVRELDAGPTYSQLSEPIRPQDTSGALLARLAERGADLLVQTLADIAAGAAPSPQAADGLTLAPKLTVDEARIDWTASAVTTDRQIRGCNPAPGAWTTVAGQRFKVLLAQPCEVTLEPGALAVEKRRVLVGTGTAALELLEVQPLGKKPMPGSDWARGAHVAGGQVLGDR